VIACNLMKGVSWIAAQDHHADMLQATVGIKQLCANGSNFRLLGKFQHRFNPVWRKNFHIVV